MSKSLKICVVSDSHGFHNKIIIPPCDILIFAGDANINSENQLIEFNKWLGKQPGKYKIIIGGNHDGLLEEFDNYKISYYLSNAIYLENESVTIEGIKFWGSPFSKEFNGWSFMRYDEDLKEIWDTIPEDTDVIIAHGPAFGRLDKIEWKNEGSQTLRDRIDIIKPKVVISGHIHSQHGHCRNETTDFYNGSVLDDNYKLVYEPLVFTYER